MEPTNLRNTISCLIKFGIDSGTGQSCIYPGTKYGLSSLLIALPLLIRLTLGSIYKL